MTDFLVVDNPSAYNTLFGWPILKDLKAITFIYYKGIKFPTTEGIGHMQGSQFDAQECYNNSLKITFRERKLP